MNNNMHEESKDVETTVRNALNQLDQGTDQERGARLSELHQLGIGTRNSIRTRGSLRSPAPNRLPTQHRIQTVVRCLGSQNETIRSLAALALGEWGGPEVIEDLTAMLDNETDDSVRLHGIAALRTVGGPKAADVLRRVAETGAEPIRDAAIDAIEEIVTGGSADSTEARDSAAGLHPEALREPIRQRSVRTRGGSSLPSDSADNARVTLADSMRRISSDEAVSRYIRQRAQVVLSRLQR